MTLASQLMRPTPESGPGSTEAYDPKLNDIRSLDQAEAYVRKSMRSPGQAEAAAAINAFVAKRFYHEYSQFRFADGNWVAALMGRIFDREFRHPTRIEDIFR